MARYMETVIDKMFEFVASELHGIMQKEKAQIEGQTKLRLISMAHITRAENYYSDISVICIAEREIEKRIIAANSAESEEERKAAIQSIAGLVFNDYAMVRVLDACWNLEER